MRPGLVLALLLIAVPVQAQTVIYFTGLETGDFSEWNAIGGCTVNSASAKSGKYAVAVQNTAHQCRTTGGWGLTTSFIRAQYQLVTWTGGSGAQDFLQLCNSGDTACFQVFLTTTSKLAWGTSPRTAIATGATTVTNSVYHLVEVKCVVSATVGGCEVKLDGNTEFTSLGTNTSSITSVDHLYVSQNAAVSSSILVDDIMVCSGAYCPHGGTIARQGTGGSPTYTAWTLNSCTGGTIDGCWSETPFTATTPSASSTVLNDAQTMVVYDFATAQTGHGTDTIGNVSTINACKTAMVANASANGNVVATVLAQGGGTGAQTTASITPVSGQLVLVWNTNSNNSLNTITGTNAFNVTWTNVKNQGATAGSLQFDRGVTSSGTAGTITITPAGGIGNVSYIVVQYAGVDQTTTQGVRQSGISLNNGSVTSLATSLAAYGSTINATVYGALSNATTSFTDTAPYTGATTQANNSKTLGVNYRTGGQDLAPNGGTMGSAGAMVAGAAELVSTAVQMSMRRRISGSDTDTAKTITTTNAYYEDGIWTTTAGVLGNSANMEIGAKQGANTVTQTVRDMWLMCDYLSASQAPRHKVYQQ